MKIVRAAAIVIGDEVLSGRTRDANIQTLARFLRPRGVRLSEVRVIPDHENVIIEAVNTLRARHDYVFTSGGIGPTHDDITAQSVAAAFGAPIAIRDDARAILTAHYGDQLNEARLRMARIPDGAALIANPVSAAPGFILGNVHVMAGVPRIFAAMLEQLSGLIVGAAPMQAHSFRVVAPEGEIAAPLAELAAKTTEASFGSYPFMGEDGKGLGSVLIARSADPAALSSAAEALRAMLNAMGAPYEETEGETA